MKQLIFLEISVASLLLVLLLQQPAMAYVGPGAGLAALGAFLAIVAGVFAAIFGFLWYPVKRLLRKRKRSRDNNKSEGEAK
jgi:membrane protein implicated in regulation of membrane protease activity